MDFKKIFEIAISKNASDVHLVHGFPPIIRIDGELFGLEVPAYKIFPLSASQSFRSENVLGEEDLLSGDLASGKKIINSEFLNKTLEEILTKEQLKTFLEEKDYDFGYQIDDYRFRVNLSYERNNLKLVARIISHKRPLLKDIDMPDQVTNLLKLKQGLILVTGPTGCGKSTSLAAMLNYINDNRNCNIVTFEDPIEFVFKSNKSIITQRQLGTDMNSFASGLKHVLRQDPNVIMVGEMRDLETISTVITLAETGHLVLATLHTRNASQTIDRIIDIFPPHQQNQIKAQLSLILSAVVSQVLIPKKGGGRIAVREIMINNTAISNLIRDQKISQIKNVIETHSTEGMMSFERSLKNLYERDLVNEEDTRKFLNNRIIFG